MKYLGIDVHSKASVWCLLDENGERLATGRLALRLRSHSAVTPPFLNVDVTFRGIGVVLAPRR